MPYEAENETEISESEALPEDEFGETAQEESSVRSFTAEACDEGVRADVFLAEKTGETRSFVQKLIDEGFVTMKGTEISRKYRMKNGDCVNVTFRKPKPLDVSPENIPLDIIYEDDDIIIINKCRGMTVHPAQGNERGTLVNALLYCCKNLSDINGVIRPGIVHRIDKDTTGLIAAAKNNRAHVSLAEQLKTHAMKREYVAVVEGIIKEDSATVNAPIGRHKTDRKKMAVNTENGRNAVTHFTVEERFKDATLVRCRLETGRTHQIRVHMAYIGHPVAADPLYGKRVKRNIESQALHAYRLTLTHPTTGELMTFEAEPPEDFRNLVEELRNGTK